MELDQFLTFRLAERLITFLCDVKVVSIRPNYPSATQEGVPVHALLTLTGDIVKYPSQEQWYKDNKERMDKYRADWARKDRLERPEFYRAREFAREMKKYGTTTKWYIEKLISQNGLCAICGHLSHHHGELQRLQVDHNHKCCDLKTKSCGRCLRGLLCANCNMLLGYFETVLEQATSIVPKWDTWLENALLYLTRYGSR